MPCDLPNETRVVFCLSLPSLASFLFRLALMSKKVQQIDMGSNINGRRENVSATFVLAKNQNLLYSRPIRKYVAEVYAKRGEADSCRFLELEWRLASKAARRWKTRIFIGSHAMMREKCLLKEKDRERIHEWEVVSSWVCEFRVKGIAVY